MSDNKQPAVRISEVLLNILKQTGYIASTATLVSGKALVYIGEKGQEFFAPAKPVSE